MIVQAQSVGPWRFRRLRENCGGFARLSAAPTTIFLKPASF
jgi:hypothetical protein